MINSSLFATANKIARTFLVLFAMLLLPLAASAQSNNTISLSVIGEPSIDEGGSAITVNVTLEHVVTTEDGGAVSIEITTNQSSDVSIVGSPVLIAVGQSSGTFTILATDDSTDEPNEAVNVSIGASVTGDALNDDYASEILTIFDQNGPGILFSVESTTVAEADGNITVTISTVGDVDTFQDISGTVFYNGTAVVGVEETEAFSLDNPTAAKSDDPNDANRGTASFTIAEGTSSTTVWFDLVDDDDEHEDEPVTETIIMSFGDTDEQAGDDSDTETVSITDDDVFVNIAWESAPKEGGLDIDETDGSGTIVVTLSHVSPFDVDIDFEYINDDDYTVGPYTSGSVTDEDYLVSSTSFTIDSGDTELDFTIYSIGDDQYEEDDDVTVNVSSAESVSGGSATIDDGTEYFSIISDDDPPTVTIEGSVSTIDESAESENNEPDFESPTFTYTVTMDAASGEDTAIFVNFSSSEAVFGLGGPPKSGETGVDFAADSESGGPEGPGVWVEIGRTNTTADVLVSVNNDQWDESTETIVADLTDIDFGYEGEEADPDGSGGSDSITLTDDDDYHPSLTVVNNTGGSWNEVDGDEDAIIVSLALSDNPTVGSGIDVFVTVNISGTALNEYDYDFEVADWDEDDSGDGWVAANITVPAGDAGVLLTFTSIDDSIYEGGDGNEFVNLTMTDVVNGSWEPSPEKIGSEADLEFDLVDDEDVPTFTLYTNDASFSEVTSMKAGEEETNLYAELSHASSSDVVFTLNYTDGSTAVWGEADKGGGNINSTDFNTSTESGFSGWEGVDTEEDFEPGDLTLNLVLTAVDDTHHEDVAGQATGETAIFFAGGLIGANLPALKTDSPNVEFALVDNDDAPTVSVTSDGDFDEDGGDYQIDVNLSHLSVNNVTANLGVAGDANGSLSGGGKAGSSDTDYTYQSVNITVPTGSISTYFDLSPVDDDVDEDVLGEDAGESVNLTVDSVVNATFSGSTGLDLTLNDDDDVPELSITILDSNDNEEDELEESEGVADKVDSEYSLLIEMDRPSVNAVSYSILCPEFEGEFDVRANCSPSKSSGNTDLSISAPGGEIAAFTTNMTHSIYIVDDNVDEWDEESSFSVNSTTAAAVNSDSDDTFEYALIDDDAPPVVTLAVEQGLLKAGESVNMTEDGSVFGNFTASLSAESEKTITLDIQYSEGNVDGIAQGYVFDPAPAYAGTSDADASKSEPHPDGTDFTANRDYVQFSPSNTTASFSIEGVSDEINEGTEIATATLAYGSICKSCPMETDEDDVTLGDPVSADVDLLDSDSAPEANDDNIIVAEDGQVEIDVLIGHDSSETPAFDGSDADADDDYCVGKSCQLSDLLDILDGDDSDGDGPDQDGVGYTLPEFGTLEVWSVNTSNWTSAKSVVSDPQFRYTPDPDYSGLDSFTYTLDDGRGLPSTATVTLYVVGENDAPNAQIDVVETNEDTPIIIAVLDNDEDPDGDTLTISSVTQGDNGETDGVAVANEDGTITFTPTENWNGPARFDYEVSDGFLTDSEPVTVNVLAVNDAPTVVADTSATDFQTAVIIAVSANDSDVEGNTFAADSVGTPANGTAVLEGDGTVTYTPNAGFTGEDGFTYASTDSEGARTTDGTVVVNVGMNPNSAPVAVDDESSADDGASVVISVLANDTDANEGATLSVTAITQPADGEGTATDNGDGTVTYTAPAGFEGTATFTYTVSDGELSDTGSVSVVVTIPAGNHAPTAMDDSESGADEEAVVISVLANDTDDDGDTLTITIVTQPAAGTGAVVDNADGTLTYTSPADFEGTATFSYTISDGNGGSSTAEVFVSVTADDDGIETVVEDGVDGDGDGEADGDGNGDGIDDADQAEVASLTVVADTDGASTDSYITVEIVDNPDDDGDDDAILATVVSTPNPAPESYPDGATSPLGFLSFDVEDLAVGDTSTVKIFIPEGAVVTDYLKYGPTADDPTDHWYSFLWDAASNTGAVITPEVRNDMDELVSKGFVTLTFIDGARGDKDMTANGTVEDPGTPVFLTNEAPVAGDDSAAIQEDDSADIDLLANDTDADEDVLTIASIGTAENGTVTDNGDGTVTYTPNAHYNGSDSFTYTVTDNRGEAVEATVTVDIEAVDDLPVATDDSAETSEEAEIVIDIFANDFHPDGIDFFVVQIADPDNGTAVYHNDGTMTYTPDDNFAGTETFTYTIADARGPGSFVVGTVTVTVEAAPDAPVAVEDASETAEDTAVSIAVTANDTDADGDDVSIESVTQGAHGTVTDNGDGSVTYTPEADFNGTDTFTYVATDGTNSAAAATVTVTVTAVNDAPVFAAGDVIATPVDPFALDADYTFTYDAATDVDGDALTYTWEISISSTFGSVAYSAELSDLTGTISAADLIAALEPEGLTPDSQLMVYQRVSASDGEETGSSDGQSITFTRATNVSNESSEIPTEYYLSGNYPNPFNPSTTIEFGLPEATDVSIVLYDMTGRLVQTLTQQHMAAGVHTVNVQMGDLPSGLYIYRMISGSKVFSNTMHLIK